ncbi:Ger(x)C family spore germination protein [Brevibacillus fluminis]|uniref:Ger(X)C family spore germination protein n=1 Tax=Brevibacillus fluminis TaxID=511487 RepID=A0A3M8CTF8_9BACL|nr:Ger(x)C family spore germination protein [Brevibacillus fluminis]RNB78537.1 Ger(x)C family spore germination protein [Brevibacillus fluminis]
MNNKRFLFGFFLFVFLLPLYSCGFKDLDKRALVVSIGVDQGEKLPYKITVKIAVPSAETQKAASNPFILLSEEAFTITEAVRLLKSKVSKELDFGQAKMVIIGEGLAKKNVHDVIDWLLRRRDIQKIALMTMGRPRALDVLKVKPVNEKLAANALILFFDKSGTESAFTLTEHLADFHRRLKERGKDPFLPIVEASDQHYIVDKVALFNKEKMVMELTKQETRLLHELMYDFKKVDVVSANKRDRVAVSISDLKTKYQFDWNQESPIIRVHMEMRGTLEESHRSIKVNLHAFEQEINKTSNDRIRRLLQKLQKGGVDPIGFGLQYRASHHDHPDDEWKKWQQLYPKVVFNVTTNLCIRSTGLIE